MVVSVCRMHPQQHPDKEIMRKNRWYPSPSLVKPSFPRNWKPLWRIGSYSGRDKTEESYDVGENLSRKWWKKHTQRSLYLQVWGHLPFPDMGRESRESWVSPEVGKGDPRLVGEKTFIQRSIGCKSYKKGTQSLILRDFPDGEHVGGPWRSAGNEERRGKHVRGTCVI